MEGFKQRLSLEERKSMAQQYLSKYKGRLPVILEPHSGKKFKALPQVKGKKLVLEEADHMSSITRTLKQKLIQVKKETECITLIVNNQIVNLKDTIRDVYDKNVDQDGFLYIHYCGQEIYG